MTVHFIGAGPGAADLITLRGRDLIARCPVCLYAGSIVPRELLAHCPPGARLIDTAPLTLDEIEARIRSRACGRARRGAAAFGRSVDLQRAGRAAPPAEAARHSVHAHARRPGLCGGGRRARARAHGAGGGAKRGADPHAGPRLAHAAERAPRRLRGQPARRSRSIWRSIAIEAHRGRADAVLRRRLPGRRGGAGELAATSASCAARSAISRRKSPPSRSSAPRWCWSDARLRPRIFATARSTTRTIAGVPREVHHDGDQMRSARGATSLPRSDEVGCSESGRAAASRLTPRPPSLARDPPRGAQPLRLADQLAVAIEQHDVDRDALASTTRAAIARAARATASPSAMPSACACAKASAAVLAARCARAARAAGRSASAASAARSTVAALGVKIEQALRELGHLGDAARDRDPRHRMGAEIFEHAADEIAHVDQRGLGQAVELAHRCLRGRAGRAGDVREAGRARHVDAAMDRVDPGRAGIRHDDAGGAEDRQAADDAEPAR